MTRIWVYQAVPVALEFKHAVVDPFDLKGVFDELSLFKFQPKSNVHILFMMFDNFLDENGLVSFGKSD